MLPMLNKMLTGWGIRARRVYAVDVAWRAVREFQQQEATTAAAAVSYYVLFSLFPLMAVLVAIFGLFVRNQTIQEQVVDAIVDQFPAEVNIRPQVEQVVSGLAQSRSGVVGLVGLLGAAWTASGMFGALRRALNRAFDVPGTRPFLHGKLIDLISILGVLTLALLSIAATTALGTVRVIAGEVLGGALPTVAWTFISALLPLGLSFIMFIAVYRLLPNLTVRLSELWVGALLAAVGFELAKAGFGLYVTNFGRYEEVYGALGGAAVFLLFIFIVTNIVIFAAQVTSELAKDRSRTTTGR
jgi:membrane protein